MNERMVELFEQAGISDSINEEFDIEYLAELIVKECANKIERDYKYVTGTDTKWNTAFTIACDLKEHFGVE